MKQLYFFAIAIVLAFSATAQKFQEHPEEQEARNKGNALLLHLGLGIQLPGGDLADRFGYCGSYGGGFEFMTANNYFIGFEGHAMFGKEVREDPLSILRTPEGHIIGNNRAISGVALRERGLYLGGVFGKLFTFDDQRRGIRASMGAGWLQHRIYAQDDDKTLTQLTGDYSKGYDRFTGGFALNQFIGWQKLGKLKRSNFMIGLEFTQGFTQSRRDWDFSEMRKLDGKRLDLTFGIKAAWTLPFYVGSSEELYY
ncbi:MAG: hypothetical protein R3A50_05995 [Saprospiraceae bacterium]